MANPRMTLSTWAFLDLDVADRRGRLRRGAAFVHATDTRYGWSSKTLSKLGGSELPRVLEFFESDIEFGSGGPIDVRPATCGCRVVVKLLPEVAPLAAENFLRLCRGEEPGVGQCGKPLRYEGSAVHRIVPGFVIQGGDFVKGNGSGGESVWGKKFKDDRGGLALRHDRAGLVSMGNNGKNGNTSQFFFTLAPQPKLDGKHVIFGEVVAGMAVLRDIERVGAEAVVRITACGEWIPGQTPGAGYWLDDPDPETFAGFVPRFVAFPRVGIVAPNEQACVRFVEALAALKGSATCVIERSTTVDVEAATARASKWLADGAVDIVIVAPACSDVAGLLAPRAPQDGMILVSKPAKVCNCLTDGGWWSTKWMPTP